MNREIVERIKKRVRDPQSGLSFLADLASFFPKAEVYLVGGAVRDYLLGREPKDLDFVVRNVGSEELIGFFEGRSDKRYVDLVGKRFGVIKFLPDAQGVQEPYEIALPRKEVSTHPGGYRDFEIESSPEIPLEEDLSRRDFTINAIAVNLENYQTVDPFSGIDDLEKKIIRTVGSPEERFSEDYLRMLRAIRFSIQLGFRIEEITWQTIRKFAGRVLEKKGEQWIIPPESIWQEFQRSFYSDPVRTLELYDEAGFLELLFPEVKELQGTPQPEEYHQEGDVYDHTILLLKTLAPDSPLELKLAALFHDIGKPETLEMPKEEDERIKTYGHAKVGGKIVDHLAQKWRWSGELKEKVRFLVKNHMAVLNEKVAEEMRPSKIKAYFLDNPQLGEMLIRLIKADMRASCAQVEIEDERFEILGKRIEEIKEQFRKSQVQNYSDIISGHVVIEQLKLKPGREVGEKLRQAEEYITDYIAQHGRRPETREVLEHLRG